MKVFFTHIRLSPLLVRLFIGGAALAVGPRTEVNAADFYQPEDPSCGIQQAIDALPSEGGVVVIPPGTYYLRRPLIIRDHVTLRGAGSSTILTQPAQVHSLLARAAHTGESSVELRSTEGFRAGDEVMLFDKLMHGWYAAHCFVKSVHPQRLTFTESIHCAPKGLDKAEYLPEREAVVINYFPAIRASRLYTGKPVRAVTIQDLTFDGNLKENPGPWWDFTVAAIHLANVSDAVIRNCKIRGWIGDGICVSDCQDTRVESCLVERCRQKGMHAGGSGNFCDAVFANNICRFNEDDGLHFCSEVREVVVSGNLFHDNRGCGIGGVGVSCEPGSSDSFNIIIGNICRNNGLWGIELIGGKNNVVTGNVCQDNSRETLGSCSGILVKDTMQTLITSNRCGSDTDKPSQKYGIEECGQSNENVIAENICQGNAKGGITIVGRNTRTSANVPEAVRLRSISED